MKAACSLLVSLLVASAISPRAALAQSCESICQERQLDNGKPIGYACIDNQEFGGNSLNDCRATVSTCNGAACRDSDEELVSFLGPIEPDPLTLIAELSSASGRVAALAQICRRSRAAFQVFLIPSSREIRLEHVRAGERAAIATGTTRG